MRRFAYETNGKNGRVETFFLPQTPQEFASRATRRVSSSKFMDGVKHFSMLVWALPEGVTHIDDVPRSSPARATYIQCGGSAEAMTIEIRVTHDDGSYEQYTVAREPVTDPEAWTTRCPGTTGTPSPTPSRSTPRRSSPASRPPPSSGPTSRTTPYHQPTCYAESTSNHHITVAPHPPGAGPQHLSCVVEHPAPATLTNTTHPRP